MKIDILDRAIVTQTQRWCWFPTVQKFATGEVLAHAWMAPDEDDPESVVTGFCISQDGGRSWGPRTPKGHGGHSRVALPDGTMLEMGYHTAAPSAEPTTRFQVPRILYRDAGRAFEQSVAEVTFPEPISPRPAKPYQRAETGSRTHVGTYFDHTILPSTDGALLATMYRPCEGSARYRVMLVRSTDEGHTWRYLSTIAAVGETVPPGVGKEGFNETGMVRLASGDLLCVIRTGGDGTMFQSRSADEGVSWSTPESTGLEGVFPALCRLSNGVLALSYGRPGPVSIAFSEDGSGTSWTNVTPIFAERSTCYTSMVEIEPNLLLLIHDHAPKGWVQIDEPGLMNSVQSVRVRVER